MTIPDPTPDVTTAALEYANLGWYVFPTGSGDDGKGPHPSLLGSERTWATEATCDPQGVVALFAGLQGSVGIGVHLGPSGLIVLDGDRLPALLAAHPELGTTPTWTMRGNPERRSFLFTQSTPPAGGGRPEWGEVKAGRGYVLLPPSPHPIGGRYEWVSRPGDAPVSLPDAIRDRLGTLDPSEAVRAATAREVMDFTGAHTLNLDPGAFETVRARLETAVTTGGNLHPEVSACLVQAMEEARAGAYPAAHALEVLEAEWTEGYVKQGRPKTGLRGEWRGLVSWAIGKAAAKTDDEVQARRDRLGIFTAPADLPSALVGVPPGGAVVTVHAGPAAAYFAKGQGLLVDVLARRVLSELDVATSHDGRLWVYRHGVWAPDDEDLRTVVRDALGSRYRRNHVLEVESYLRGSRLPRIDPLPIPEYVNVENGLYRWREDVLEPHRPDVLSTVQLPVAWDEEARCPTFDGFLEEVLPPDLLTGYPGFIWEVLGYALFNGNPHHKALLLHGGGRNGKGTLLRVLTAVMGERNVAGVPLHELSANRFRAATLYGKLANIAGDLDATYIESTATFKGITGGDRIQGEHKYGAVFEFTPWALPVYSANAVFASADNTVGYLSRWLVIPFPNSFEGREDLGLTDRLLAEREGILRKAMSGLRVLMARGSFKPTESTASALAEFATKSDPIRAFLETRTDLDPDRRVGRPELYRAYREWCETQGVKPRPAVRFNEGVGSARPTVGVVKNRGDLHWDGLYLLRE